MEVRTLARMRKKLRERATDWSLLAVELDRMLVTDGLVLLVTDSESLLRIRYAASTNESPLTGDFAHAPTLRMTPFAPCYILPITVSNVLFSPFLPCELLSLCAPSRQRLTFSVNASVIVHD